MTYRLVVHRGVYHDSIALMLASSKAEAVPGVHFAAAISATPLNLELLARQGFEMPTEPVSPQDMVVAIRAEPGSAVAAALAAIEAYLNRPGSTDPRGADVPATPLSLMVALREDPDISLAVISVPGSAAAYEIASALDHGANVFCFSSGLAIEEEASLKRRAADMGLLLMGPDCGTAIVDGVALGFANHVRSGPIGIVGASGTGMQELICLLDAGEVGISQAIGVGSRDLLADVGGIMTHRALELLENDPSTEAILVMSKPPDASVLGSIVRKMSDHEKPGVLVLLGWEGNPASIPVPTVSLVEEGAKLAAALVGAELDLGRGDPPESLTPGAIHGLFSGGSLCYEVMAVLAGAGLRVRSNIAVPPAWRGDGQQVDALCTDFGTETLTEGRPHPMIDPTLRLERLAQDAADHSVGVIVLDMVLGYGAHPDPASQFVPAIARAAHERRGSLTVVVSVCGTDGDPQGLAEQVAAFREAGALVSRSAASAARVALAAAGRPVAPVPPESQT